MSAPKFHLFPALPMEIRLQIWSYTLDESRDIHLICDVHRDAESKQSTHSFKTNTSAPSILYACRESRFETNAIAIYPPSFGTKHLPPRIPINFHRDTIHIQDRHLSHLHYLDMAKIRHLVVDIKDWAYFWHYHMDTIKNMGALETLDLIVKEGVLNSWDDRSAAQILLRYFEVEREDDDGWRIPRLRVLDTITGRLLGEVDPSEELPSTSAE
jgi:hypothetical protein